MNESRFIVVAQRASARKILVFHIAVLTLIFMVGSAMYVIEGEQEGTAFTSIPRSIYWAIVTLTTVGFGDITSQTVIGQILASIVMIMGYGIIAIPTGIVSVEMSRTPRAHVLSRGCASCGREGHDGDAFHYKYCGERL